MSGGTVLIHGPTANFNGAVDYDGSFKITGGMLVAVGSSGMAQAPDYSSTQCSLLLRLKATYHAGSLIHIQNSDGQDVLNMYQRTGMICCF